MKIEIDDYVNGCRVIYVDKDNNEIKTDSSGIWQTMKFEDVKSITKREDFEMVEQSVEESEDDEKFWEEVAYYLSKLVSISCRGRKTNKNDRRCLNDSNRFKK